ncbi:MAG: creatininase family protein [Chloroflexi bacterium]|nr:creatininase family protein [Chloroflexota bacterium]
MRFDDLNWQDVASYLEQNDRIILVTGSTEQHAFLSLTTDNQIPLRIADAVGQRTHTLVAPPLNFGVTPYFMSYPGTISLQNSTFDAVVVDIVSSLTSHGFRRFFVLNGHGGNEKPAVLDDMDVRVVWHNWWQSPVVQNFAADLQLTPGHANWLENFPFNRLIESPTARKPTVDIDYTQPALKIREMLGDGSTGDYYAIRDEHMNRLFALVVDEVTRLVVNLR